MSKYLYFASHSLCENASHSLRENASHSLRENAACPPFRLTVFISNVRTCRLKKLARNRYLTASGKTDSVKCFV